MLRSVVCRVLPLALVLSAAVAVPGARAASVRQVGPPAGVDAAHPTVSGTLLAKPITGAAPTGALLCGDRDRAPEVRAAMVNRGLVVCTDAGAVVLLQLSGKTGLFNRNWRRIGVGGMALHDHINAWGVLRTGGLLLSPTFAVQDTSRPGGTRLTLVSGRLIARPIIGESPAGTVICGDRDQTQGIKTLMVMRGLVICTDEGRLLLLEISAQTKLFTHDRVAVTVSELSLGDRINAWGIFKNPVMSPTLTVVDANLVARNTNSQDFITRGGPDLMLDVLQSDAGGPVQGITHAEQGDAARVLLCGGKLGAWLNLHAGQTIDIRNSIFNTRTMTYVDTELVRVVGC